MIGRPRDPAAGRAILDATIDLLAEKGYSCLTIDEVAHRAGVSKATIYRRWHSKLPLVLEAVQDGADSKVPVPNTGTVEGDLLAVVESYVEVLTTPLGVALARLLADAAPDPVLRSAVHEGLVLRRQRALRTILERGVATGEIRADAHDDLDLVLELGSAALLHRLLVSDRPLDKAYAVKIVRVLEHGIGLPDPLAGTGRGDGHAPRGWDRHGERDAGRQLTSRPAEEASAVATWRIRDFHDDDLDAAVRLWDDPTTAGAAAAFGLSELIAAIRAHEPAVVAVVGDEVVGSAVAMVDRDHAWVMRISLAREWRKRGIGSSLLTELEQRLVAIGVHRISCLLLSDTEVGAVALEHSGYTARHGLVLFEKTGSLATADVGILGQLGGRMLKPGLWDQLGGMVHEKELIERRVILPLANPELSDRLGLEPPRGIVLFGPPGTGKTTFAKGVASRLGWPFVELFPSRLAGESAAGLAAALREAFALVGELDNVVLFIDEVEEIAGMRELRSPSASHGVTNEMLKLIPAFREREGRLLVCATNSVRALDAAFLRHGRFDYVIPVGPPDEAARRAIWGRYLEAIPHRDLDVDAIVSRSKLLTPADIEFAARRTAQMVFEQALFHDGTEEATTATVLDVDRDDPPAR